jgi:hypothetical protein
MRHRLPDTRPTDIKALNRGIIPAPRTLSDTGQDAQRFIQMVPWWETKPPQAQDFLAVEKGQALAAVAGTQIVLTGARFRVPAENVAVIKSVQIFIDATTLLTDVDFAVRFNGGPVSGWDQLTTFPRASANLSIAFEGTIMVPVGVEITMTAINNAATGPWVVGGQFTGWYLSQREVERIYGRQARGY